MCDALDLEYEAEPSLKRIRDVRNEAIGHPTKRGRGKNATFHQISRISITQRGFDLMTMDTSGDAHVSDVDVVELIGLQRDALRSTLTNVIKKLERVEMEHREKFRGEKLVEAFPETLGYTFEKITETIYSIHTVELGNVLLASRASRVYGVVAKKCKQVETKISAPRLGTRCGGSQWCNRLPEVVTTSVAAFAF